MPVIVGIDAAWTATNPSGVSVIKGRSGEWRLVAVARSYAAFYQLAGYQDGEVGFSASLLLGAATRLAGDPVDLVAADIPLAHSPIIGRRESDNAVSRLYGSRHAGTHTPSALRPGALADRMRAELGAEGFALQTLAPVRGGLIEVYPHPALIELASAPKRLPYKIGKTTKYWPGLSVLDRRANLLDEWRRIIRLLDVCIDGTAELLPPPPIDAPASVLKGYEDALDAVVCGWVGTCALDGTAIALGDAASAIWVPSPARPVQAPPG